jgi:tetratricopeptide (TPR) repeat protein
MVNNNWHSRLPNQPRVSVINMDSFTPTQPSRLRSLNSLASYRSDFKRALAEFSLGHFDEARPVLSLLITNLEPLIAAKRKGAAAAEAHLLYASTLTWFGRTCERLDQERESLNAYRRAKAEFQQWISKEKEPSGRMYLDYGVALFKLGSRRRALEALTNAANEGSLNAEGNFYMGICLEHVGKPQEAEKCFRKALNLDPNHYISRKALAELLERDKRVSDAVNEYRTVILQMLSAGSLDQALVITNHILKLTRQAPELLALKGDILRLQGDLKGALRILNRCLKREPKNAFAKAVKGLVLLEMDKKDMGVQLLEEAFKLDPKIDWVPVELATELNGCGDDIRALSVLNKALATNPRNIDALIQKGETLSSLGRNDEALRAFEKALELKPNDAFLLGKIGQTLRLLNKYQKALKVLHRAKERDPRVGWIHGELGAVLYGMNQYYDALQAVIDALAMQPDNVFALSYKSEILRSLGMVEDSVERTEEALQVIDQALALSPDDPWALGTKGQVLRDLGRLDEALEILQQSIDRNPKLGWVYLEFGATQYSLGKYSLALEAVDKALSFEDDSEWNLFKAQILCEVGNFREVVRTVDHVIESNKNISAAFGIKGWALQHLGPDEAPNALKAYESAIKLQPHNLWWHKGVANAWYLMRFKAKASAKYRWVIRRAEQESKEAPNDISLLSLQGWCYYRLGKCDEAVRLFRQIVSLSSEEIANQFDLALALIDCKRYPESWSEYRRGVRRSRELPSPRRYALISIALDDLNVAIRMQPDLKKIQEIEDVLSLLEASLTETEN